MGEFNLDVVLQPGLYATFVDAIKIPESLEENALATYFLGRTYNFAVNIDNTTKPQSPIEENPPIDLNSEIAGFKTSLKIFNSFATQTPDIPSAENILNVELARAQNLVEQSSTAFANIKDNDPSYSLLIEESKKVSAQINSLR